MKKFIQIYGEKEECHHEDTLLFIDIDNIKLIYIQSYEEMDGSQICIETYDSRIYYLEGLTSEESCLNKLRQVFGDKIYIWPALET